MKYYISNRTIFNRVNSPIWVGVIVLALAIVAIIFSSRILYSRTVGLLTDNLRERILTISITAAANIDASDLSQLNIEDDWKKPEWTHVVGTLHKAKYSNPDVVFMYIFRKKAGNQNEMEFVADADSIDPFANSGNDTSKFIDVNRDGKVEPDGPDKLQWPGQPYPEAADIPEAFEAYNGPLTSHDLYTDEYGTVITGYAPIKDSAGNIVAVLATDIKADDFLKITTQTLQPFKLFIGFLTGIISLLTIIIMYTARKYESFLEKSKEQTEKLALNLEKANARLQALDKQKSEFVSIASHQLRSPLAAIRGYTSMLLDGTYGVMTNKATGALDRIHESAKLMAFSIEDFLNVSRIESGNMKYELSDFNLKEQAEHIVDDLRPEAVRAGLLLLIKTNITTQGVVHADIGKTQQILHNLINNALKYTQKGSITVSVQEQKKQKKLIVEFIDTGIGMSQETIGKLFEKFSRAKNANTINIKGTGLGLFVAREMARAMNGDITAHSDGEGKGSRFILTLPLVK